MSKSYQELMTLNTYEDRLAYLRTMSSIGVETFGHNRYLNQRFYTSDEWKKFRRNVILRDNGCDLGIDERLIHESEQIVIHHINPISVEDLLNGSDSLLDMNNAIACTKRTHNLIHYGNKESTQIIHKERSPGDTCPWKKG